MNYDSSGLKSDAKAERYRQFGGGKTGPVVKPVYRRMVRIFVGLDWNIIHLKTVFNPVIVDKSPV